MWWKAFNKNISIWTLDILMFSSNGFTISLHFRSTSESTFFFFPNFLTFRWHFFFIKRMFCIFLINLPNIIKWSGIVQNVILPNMSENFYPANYRILNRLLRAVLYLICRQWMLPLPTILRNNFIDFFSIARGKH